MFYSYKVHIMKEFLRGMTLKPSLLFRGAPLRLGKNFVCNGQLYLSKGGRQHIGANCKFYMHNTIGEGCIIGDNVELRCNGGNKICIGDRCHVSRNVLIIGNVSIGNDCLISPSVTIIGGNHTFSDKKVPINQQGGNSKGVIIEEDVWIGAQVIVLDGVTVGKGSVIGAGAVVTKSIPPYSIAIGSPCKVIKFR